MKILYEAVFTSTIAIIAYIAMKKNIVDFEWIVIYLLCLIYSGINFNQKNK